MSGKKILAIGGHIGDMELTCGGIMAENSLQGGTAVTLALTPGEKGAPAGMDIGKYREQKIKEAHDFMNIIGGKAYVLEYGDGELPDNEEVRMQVCDIIRKERPDMIVTHFQGSMHKDHHNCSIITDDAWFYASLNGFEREDPPCFAPLYYAENWEDQRGYKPYFYFGISEEGFELWKKAIQTHWFVTGSTSFPYFEYYCHLKRIRGIEARKPYAETFMADDESMRKVVRDL